MKINELLEEFDKLDKYLRVENVGPAYPNPDGGFVKSPGLHVSLIENGEPVTASNGNSYVGLSCIGGNKWTDEAIRNTMKEYYDVSDDIEVRYVN